MERLLELEANMAALKQGKKWKTYLHTIVEPIENLGIQGLLPHTIEAVVGQGYLFFWIIFLS